VGDYAVGFVIKYAHTNLYYFDWWGEIEQGGMDETGVDPVLARRATDVFFRHDDIITNQMNTNVTIRMQTEYWLDGPEIYTSYPRQVGNLSTRIEGLTSEPIVLKDYFSQTFEGEHIRRSERFVFEPRLEPGMSAQVLAELEAMDAQQLVFTHRFGIPRLRIIGRDRVLREW
jgi:hypothetical protein